MLYFAPVDNPKYSFEIAFGEYRLRLTVFRTISGRFIDIYDVKTKKMVYAGQSIRHGANFFACTPIKAIFMYVNISEIDPVDVESFLNGGFILEPFI